MKKIIIPLLCIMLLITMPINAKANDWPETSLELYITSENFNEGYSYSFGTVTLEYIEVYNRANRAKGAYITTIPIGRTLEFDNRATKEKIDCFTLENDDGNLTTGVFDPSKKYYLNILLDESENINNLIDCIYFNGMPQTVSTTDPQATNETYHNVRFELPKTSYMYAALDGSTRKYYFEEPIETGYRDGKVFIGFSSAFDDASKIYTEYPTETLWEAYPIWDDLKIIEQPSSSNNYTVKTNESKNWLHYNDVSFQWEMYKETNEIVFDGDPYPAFGAGDVVHSGNDYIFTFDPGITPAIMDAEIGTPKATLGASGTLVIKGENLIGKILSLNLSSAPSNLYNKKGTRKDFTYNSSTNRYEFVIEEENVDVDTNEFKFNFDVPIDNVTIEVYLIDTTPNWHSIYTANPNQLDTREYGKYRCRVDLTSDGSYIYSNEITFAPQVSTSKPKRYITRATNTKEVIDPVTGTKKDEAIIESSGKKGSTVTITLPENRRVLDVIVKDKKGNEIALNKVDEKTLTFIQPASDVNVDIKYINKQIDLEIGSFNAKIDDFLSKLDVAPVVKNDTTFMPVRFIAENLDATVEWNEKEPDKVKFKKGDREVIITLGSSKIIYNGIEVDLKITPFVEKDRTMVPVRFLSEFLGAEVRWSEESPNEVHIYGIDN